jgi:hypothetical protein
MSINIDNLTHQLNFENFKPLCDNIINKANNRLIICDNTTLYDILYSIGKTINYITNLTDDYLNIYSKYMNEK